MTKSEPEKTLDLAVVGGGVAGLTAARIAHTAQLSTRIFDKGRGPGGRLSSRRMQDTRFDHGARAFSLPDGQRFLDLERWCREGVVERWSPRGQDHDTAISTWVGRPGMNAVVKQLAQGLDVTFGARITELMFESDQWTLRTEDRQSVCRARNLILAVPAPQAHELLVGTVSPSLSILSRVSFSPIWVVMFYGPDRDQVGFDTLEAVGPFSRIDAQASKPDRADDHAWVGYASIDWSTRHLEDDPQEIADALKEALEMIFQCRIEAPVVAHRWRYAITQRPVGKSFLSDQEINLLCCGDWCLGSTVGDALRSGFDAGKALVARTHP